MSSGQAADVVVRLDRRRDRLVAARLDHVRVERALDEVADLPELLGLPLEDADELLADRAPFLLGVGDAGELAEEALLGVDVDERDVEVVAERLDDLHGLVFPEQAVIDEDARELVADGLVDEQRGDRRVHSARERAQHALRPDLRADPLDLLLDHGGGGPAGRRVRDRVEEVLEEIVAVGRVHDLGVELHAVQSPLRVLEGRDRRRLRRGDDPCALRRRGDRVAVAHPADLLLRQVHEELAALDGELRLAELGDAGPLDPAAELLRHDLHPVTDAERRDAEREDARIDLRRAVRVDRRGPARENERQRVAPAHLVRADRMRHELGVDAALAHAPRDQLRVLASAVQNEHRPLFGGRLRRWQWDDVAHPIPIFCACCSDFPSVLIDGASMISAFWKSWIDS